MIFFLPTKDKLLLFAAVLLSGLFLAGCVPLLPVAAEKSAFTWLDRTALITDDAAKDKLFLLLVAPPACHGCRAAQTELTKVLNERPELLKMLNPVLLDTNELPGLSYRIQLLTKATRGQSGWPAVVLLDDRRGYVFSEVLRLEPLAALPRMVAETGNRLAEFTTRPPAYLREIAANISKRLNEEETARLQPGARVHAEVKQQAELLLKTTTEQTVALAAGTKTTSSLPWFLPVSNTWMLSRVAAWQDSSSGTMRHLLDKLFASGIWDHYNSGFYSFALDAGLLMHSSAKKLVENAVLLEALARFARLRTDSAVLELARVQGQALTGLFAANVIDSRMMFGTMINVTDVAGDVPCFLTAAAAALVPPPYEKKELQLAFGGLQRYTLRLPDASGFTAAHGQERLKLVRLVQQAACRSEPIGRYYVSENARAGLALLELSRATRDAKLLAVAEGIAGKLLVVNRYFPQVTHAFQDGATIINPPGYLGDYSTLGLLLLELHELTAKPHYLEKARRLFDEILKRFVIREPLQIRDTTPSPLDLGIAVVPLYDLQDVAPLTTLLLGLWKLGTVTGGADFRDLAREIAERLLNNLPKMSAGLPYLATLSAALFEIMSEPVTAVVPAIQ